MTRAAPPVPSSGLTKFRWTGLLTAGASITLLFGLLYGTAYRSVLGEIRGTARAVAIAAAVGIHPEHVEQISKERDASKPVYGQIQDFLTRLSKNNPDIRYAYIMTRAEGAFGDRSKMEFLVDQEARDADGDGVISRDEVSEPIGAPYQPPPARRAALTRGWDEPSADDRVSPDPPYPDLLSGYAPIKRGERTIAVVGVDITAATVGRKLAAIKVVMAVAWVVVMGIAFLFTQLHYQQQEAFEQIKRRADEEETELAIARVATRELAGIGGGSAGDPALREEMVYDRFDLGCATRGDALCGAFDADEDHVFFHAGRADDRGMAYALAAAMLRLSRTACLEEERDGGQPAFYLDLTRPEEVLSRINAALLKEGGGGESVCLVCGVAAPSEGRLVYASAGFGHPLRYDAAAHACEVWWHGAGPPLGREPAPVYEPVAKPLAAGDRLVWYSPELVEAADADGQAFGFERLCRLVEAHGRKPPLELVAKIREEAAGFVGCAAAPPFAMFVIGVR